MSSWGCPHQVNQLCQKLKGPYCRPGMRGCVLAGKVSFHHGEVPFPEWPLGTDPRVRADVEAALRREAGSDGEG
jgi:hypothetical protein